MTDANRRDVLKASAVAGAGLAAAPALGQAARRPTLPSAGNFSPAPPSPAARLLLFNGTFLGSIPFA